jgi:hypothetical protein
MLQEKKSDYFSFFTNADGVELIALKKAYTFFDKESLINFLMESYGNHQTINTGKKLGLKMNGSLFR